MPAAGIMPPPNDDIIHGLDAVIATWSEVQPIVDNAIAGEALNAEQLSIMFHNANALTGMMNATVGRYSDASKLGV